MCKLCLLYLGCGVNAMDSGMSSLAGPGLQQVEELCYW